MPKSKGRKKKADRSARSRAHRAAQEPVREPRSVRARRHRVNRTIGWTLVVAGIVVGVSHWLAHLGVWRFASPGVMDLTAGYPMAAVLGLVGVIMLGRD